MHFVIYNPIGSPSHIGIVIGSSSGSTYAHNCPGSTHERIGSRGAREGRARGGRARAVGGSAPKRYPPRCMRAAEGGSSKTLRPEGRNTGPEGRKVGTQGRRAGRPDHRAGRPEGRNTGPEGRKVGAPGRKAGRSEHRAGSRMSGWSVRRDCRRNGRPAGKRQPGMRALVSASSGGVVGGGGSDAGATGSGFRVVS